MRAVSADFQTEIIAHDKAVDVYGKIILNQTDSTIIPDDVTTIALTTGSTDTISSLDNAVDGVATAINYASLETDRWDLTKGFKLLPDSAPYGNMGWWSSADPITLMSDVDRVFTPYQVILITLGAEHDSAGLTIFFDINNNEYATDFNISFQDDTTAEIVAVSVVGNVDARYVYETAIVGYKYIEISIYKWSLAGRRARITEVFAGIVKEFSKSNPVNRLINFSILEEIDMTSAIVPSNSLSFTFDNIDDGINTVYDFFNPIGAFAYLKKNQKIEAYLGVMLEDDTVEYTEMGTFYLDKWISDPNGLTATFSGYDRLLLFDKIKYYDGVQDETGTYHLTDLATYILGTTLGLSASEYSIDVALDTIVTNMPLPICSCREALQYIAIASQSVIYMDRVNVLTIKPWVNVVTNKAILLTDSFTKPEVNFDDVFLQANIELYNYSLPSATEVYNGSASVTNGQVVRLFFNSQVHSSSGVGVVVAGANYTSHTESWTSNYVDITIVMSAPGTVTMVATAKVLTINKQVFNIIATPSDGTKTLTVTCPLISTEAQASDVADWIALWASKRTNIRSDWRMNPALELGDFVDIENSWSTMEDAYIVKQEFDYTGGLGGSTYVKK